MAHVDVSKTYPYPAEFAWHFLSDFFTPWHPMMAWCEQVDERTRKFGMTGEDGAYIEQITNIDHQKHSFSYTMLEGISAIDDYQGYAFVEPLDGGWSRINWQAEISGPDPIADKVAAGTTAVFQAGLDALDLIMSDVLEIKTERIAGEPGLAIDAAGAGELVLFLHGIGGDRLNWHGQIESLSSRFKCVSLDFRGYGKSDLGNGPVTSKGQVDDILRVVSHCEAEKVHLVGLSYGSWLAACFAQHYPEKISSLTLCAGSTGMSEASDKERRRFDESRLRPLLDNAEMTPADLAPAVVLAISGPNSTAFSRTELLASMQAIPRETYVSALRCFLKPPGKIPFETFDFPTMFVAGEHDTLAPPAEMQAVAQRVPGSRFEVIEGAGHMVNVEQPAEFNEILQSFLTQ
ncbi:MAG: alpha/beta fold hydrolase [Anaerolineae bacterium]